MKIIQGIQERHSKYGGDYASCHYNCDLYNFDADHDEKCREGLGIEKEMIHGEKGACDDFRDVYVPGPNCPGPGIYKVKFERVDK